MEISELSAYQRLHRTMRKSKPKPMFCETCNKKEPTDLANISPRYNAETYNENPDNWRWLCRSCHSIADYGLKSFHEKQRAEREITDKKIEKLVDSFREHNSPSSDIQTKRFYEMKELKDLNLDLNRTDPVKVFVCNFCGQWNKIYESQLMAPDKASRSKKKKVIHMVVDEDTAIGWNKFKANFGTHERAIAIALSEFYKHNH